MIRSGHIEFPYRVDGIEEIILQAPVHDGTKFSGWTVKYVEVPWLNEILDSIASIEGFGDRYEAGTWVNVLRGKGAEVPEHSEGRASGDRTVVLFLSNLNEDEGGKLVVDGTEFIPVVGGYVAFNSELPHKVTKMENDYPRITAAALYHA